MATSLKLLRDQIQASDMSGLIPMVLRNINHMTLLIYDVKNDTWQYHDANRIPALIFPHGEEVALSNTVKRSFDLNMESMREVHKNISTAFLASGDNINQLYNVVNNLRDVAEFKKIHDIDSMTVDDIKTKILAMDSEGGTWLKSAIYLDDDRSFRDFLDIARKIVQHPQLEAEEKAQLSRFILIHALTHKRVTSETVAELTKLMQAQKIDLAATGQNGNTAYDFAKLLYDQGEPQKMLALLQHAEPYQFITSHKTAMRVASELHLNNVIEKYIEDRIDLNLPVNPNSVDGLTILHQVFFDDKVDLKLINKLLDAGADPNLPSDEKLTPFMASVLYGNVAITESMINAGANMNLTTKKGDTALHLAVKSGSEEMVRLLLANGLQPDFPNAKGKTPLDLAAGNEDIQKIFSEFRIQDAKSSTSRSEVIRDPRKVDAATTMNNRAQNVDSEPTIIKKTP